MVMHSSVYYWVVCHIQVKRTKDQKCPLDNNVMNAGKHPRIAFVPLAR
jgi:hypothetical protein